MTGIPSNQYHQRRHQGIGLAAIGKPCSAVQIVRQRIGRGIPLPRRFCRQISTMVSRSGEMSRRSSAAWCRPVQHLQQRLNDIFTLERRLTCQQCEEYRAQGIDVGRLTMLRGMPRRLFGRHVAGCAKRRATDCQSSLQTDVLGQTKVSDADLILLINQDVGRLEIPVQNAPIMGELDGTGGIPHIASGRGAIEWLVLSQLFQVSPLDEVHGKVVMPLTFAALVYGDDAGVIELRALRASA